MKHAAIFFYSECQYLSTYRKDRYKRARNINYLTQNHVT